MGRLFRRGPTDPVIPPGTMAAERLDSLAVKPRGDALAALHRIATGEIALRSLEKKLETVADDEPVAPAVDRLRRQMAGLREAGRGLELALSHWPAESPVASGALTAVENEIGYLLRCGSEVLTVVRLRTETGLMLDRARARGHAEHDLWPRLIDEMDVGARLNSVASIPGAEDLHEHVRESLRMIEEASGTTGIEPLPPLAVKSGDISRIVAETSLAQLTARGSRSRSRTSIIPSLRTLAALSDRWEALASARRRKKRAAGAARKRRP
jgi:hypothetical protein